MSSTAAVKKVRKKKEEKPEEESEKNPYAKFIKDPKKKKDPPASHFKVTKATDKKKGRTFTYVCACTLATNQERTNQDWCFIDITKGNQFLRISHFPASCFHVCFPRELFSTAEKWKEEYAW